LILSLSNGSCFVTKVKVAHQH